MRGSGDVEVMVRGLDEVHCRHYVDYQELVEVVVPVPVVTVQEVLHRYINNNIFVNETSPRMFFLIYRQ